MWLIVGLGNPGTQYAFHRHNVGFMVLDHFAASLGHPGFREERRAQVTKFKVDGVDVMLAKPQTFMNLSGESVLALMDFYKISQDKLIVVHDEIDQPFGQLKIQRNRGAGGHNGIKSISQILGSQDYVRVRVGVGRPSQPQMDVASYVLQNFSKEEQALLPELLGRSGDAVESLVIDGYERAASKFSGTGGPGESPSKG